MPEKGQEETVRIVALDRSFHVNCYVCEVSREEEASVAAATTSQLLQQLSVTSFH